MVFEITNMISGAMSYVFICLFFISYIAVLIKNRGKSPVGLEISYVIGLLVTLGFWEFKDNIVVALDWIFNERHKYSSYTFFDMLLGDSDMLFVDSAFSSVVFCALTCFAGFFLYKITKKPFGDKAPFVHALNINAFAFLALALLQLFVVLMMIFNSRDLGNDGDYIASWLFSTIYLVIALVLISVCRRLLISGVAEATNIVTTPVVSEPSNELVSASVESSTVQSTSIPELSPVPNPQSEPEPSTDTNPDVEQSK